MKDFFALLTDNISYEMTNFMTMTNKIFYFNFYFRINFFLFKYMIRVIKDLFDETIFHIVALNSSSKRVEY